MGDAVPQVAPDVDYVPQAAAVPEFGFHGKWPSKMTNPMIDAAVRATLLGGTPMLDAFQPPPRTVLVGPFPSIKHGNYDAGQVSLPMPIVKRGPKAPVPPNIAAIFVNPFHYNGVEGPSRAISLDGRVYRLVRREAIDGWVVNVDVATAETLD